MALDLLKRSVLIAQGGPFAVQDSL